MKIGLVLYVERAESRIPLKEERVCKSQRHKV